jgi:hypothetical protein
MTKWLKIPPALRSLGKGGLGLVCLLAGGALFFWNGAALADSLLETRAGIPLGSLFGVAAGLIGIGGAADLLGPPRKLAAKKESIAQSIWATRAHVDQWDIGEN